MNPDFLLKPKFCSGANDRTKEHDSRPLRRYACTNQLSARFSLRVYVPQNLQSLKILLHHFEDRINLRNNAVQTPPK